MWKDLFTRKVNVLVNIKVPVHCGTGNCDEHFDGWIHSDGNGNGDVTQKQRAYEQHRGVVSRIKQVISFQVVDSQNENKDNSAETEGGVDIDETLQDELCELWDMSINSVQLKIKSESNIFNGISQFYRVWRKNCNLTITLCTISAVKKMAINIVDWYYAFRRLWLFFSNTKR